MCWWRPPTPTTRRSALAAPSPCLRGLEAVTVVIVTDGSSSQYAGDTAVAKRKEQQLRAANEILGTDEVIVWSFPDMRLDEVAHIELNRSFEKLIGERRFDTVFAHHHGDMNLDHRLI